MLKMFFSWPVTASSVFEAISETAEKALSYPRDTEHMVIPSFHGYSILLAEDSELNQKVAQQMLEKTGAAVAIAKNGSQAVEMAAAGSFDLVLMDLQMPVMDGFEATRKILEMFPELPIIALSAAGTDDDRIRSGQAGMKAHLAKPIDRFVLYRTLAQWLQAGETIKTRKAEPENVSLVLPGFMKGFDLDQGLRSSDGDPAFYHKMLHRFKEQLTSDFASIYEQLEMGDQGNGPMLIHSLKGISGTVGAYQLAETAKFIDAAFKEGREITHELKLQLERALREATEQLEKLPPLSDGIQKVDAQQGQEAMAEMLKQLRKSEMVDDELLTIAADFLKSNLGGHKTDKLVKLVENFENDAAAFMLLELAAATGVELDDPRRSK